MERRWWEDAVDAIQRRYPELKDVLELMAVNLRKAWEAIEECDIARAIMHLLDAKHSADTFNRRAAQRLGYLDFRAAYELSDIFESEAEELARRLAERCGCRLKPPF